MSRRTPEGSAVPPLLRAGMAVVVPQLTAYLPAFLALPTNQAGAVATTKKRLLRHGGPCVAYLACCFLPWAPAGLGSPGGGGRADT